MQIDRNEVERIARLKFPKETPNPGQMEAIIETCVQLLEGKKHVIVSAPTGSGKSVIATTVHRVIRHFKSAWRTTLITSTKGLQTQYTDDDRSIYDLRAKGNYRCPHGVGPYNSGACRSTIARKGCTKALECPYVRQRTHWCNIADLRITNSSFQIEACPAICMEPKNVANLIVIDECHEIDDLIVEHSSITLEVESFSLIRNYTGGQEFLLQLARYIEKFKGIPIGSTFKVSSDLYNGMHNLNESVNNLLEHLDELMGDSTRKDKELIGDLVESLQQIQDKTMIFDACDQSEGIWIMQQFGPGMMEIKPVYAWQVSNHAIFRKADQFVHMSATVCGYEEYMKNLGMKEYETAIVEVPNSIPLKFRKVMVIPTQKVSGNYDVDRLAETIDKLIERNLGKNGIVHTVSFKLANEIYERSKYKNRMLVSGDRADILEHLSSRKDGNIVMSPSIEKGYDFRGDLSRFQILAKCGFPFLGDPLVSLNSKIREGWYARKTILRVVQACGRSVRGKDDWAKTYVIDSNFLRLLRDHIEIFPDWFIESLHIVQ